MHHWSKIPQFRTKDYQECKLVSWEYWQKETMRLFTTDTPAKCKSNDFCRSDFFPDSSSVFRTFIDALWKCTNGLWKSLYKTDVQICSTSTELIAIAFVNKVKTWRMYKIVIFFCCSLIHACQPASICGSMKMNLKKQYECDLDNVDIGWVWIKVKIGILCWNYNS